MDNPFTFGNPIRDPARFNGRQDEIQQIVNRLLSSAHESTSIVGERRIGKTSLLYHLTDPQVAARLGLAADQYCLVYLDFQGLSDITPLRFWQRVLKKMARTVCHQSLVAPIEALLELDSLDLFDLEDLFETISHAGLNTVFLLDEFEYVTQNPNFKSDFFGGLRALAIHHNLALVTATRRELVDLCHSAEIKGSPFFNIFANVVLRPFSHAEVLALMRGYLAGSDLAFSPQEEELVASLGGGQPFFVQMAGSYLVEARRKGIPAPEFVQRVTADFDQQADPHFTYLWSHCSESERISLLALIALHRQKPSKKTLPTLENLARIHARAQLDVPDLVKRGLLVEDAGEATYCLFSPSLERWIKNELAAAPGSQETPASVEAWLKAGGRDKVEPVKGVLPRFKKQYWPIVSTVMREMSFELAGAATFEFLLKMLL